MSESGSLLPPLVQASPNASPQHSPRRPSRSQPPSQPAPVLPLPAMLPQAPVSAANAVTPMHARATSASALSVFFQDSGAVLPAYPTTQAVQTHDLFPTAHQSPLRSIEIPPPTPSSASEDFESRQLQLNNAIVQRDLEISQLKAELESVRQSWQRERDELQAARDRESETKRLTTDAAKTALRACVDALPDISQGALPFGADSPFFRAELAEQEEMVHRMGHNIKQVATLAQQMCEANESTKKAVAALIVEIEGQSWSDAEFNSKSTTSFETVLSDFANMLREVQASRDILMFTLETSFVQPLRDFKERYVRSIKDNTKIVHDAQAEYENALTRYLLVKKTKPYIVQSQDSAWHAVQTLHARYEMLRFSHTMSIASLQMEKKFDLLERLSAAHAHFSSYFHAGTEICATRADAAATIPVLLSEQRARAADIDKQAKTYRAMLEANLHDKIDSTDVLPVPSFENTAENANLSSNHMFPAASVLTTESKTVAHCVDPFSPIEKQGYLLKQTTGLMKDWKRRWFVLKNGSLSYYRSANPDDGELVVQILLCTVRECAPAVCDLRNCFEIISPNRRVYLLQAETEADMRAWMRAIQSCTEHQLVSQEATGSTMHQPAGDVSASVKSRLSPTSALVKKSEVLAIRQAVRVRNLKCVDCNQPDPEWVSLNLCVKMCVECSGVHRSMGVHVSKVRSLTLDAWDADSLRMLDAVTNDEFNAVWEAELHGGHISKPGPTDSRELKEQFAHAKYVDRAFVSTRVRDLQVMIDDSPLELAEMFVTAARDDKFADLMHFMAAGVDPSLPDPKQGLVTPLHAACAADRVLSVEFLLHNNASPTARDADNRSPIDYARNAHATNVLAVLEAKGLLN